jgi:hypothetical protein
LNLDLSSFPVAALQYHREHQYHCMRLSLRVELYKTADSEDVQESSNSLKSTRTQSAPRYYDVTNTVARAFVFSLRAKELYTR